MLVPEPALNAVYRHEAERPDAPWLTQPLGGGASRVFTFRQAMEEARRVAAWLGAQGFAPGSRIAIFSKNCAWWFLADLAIMMAGHVSVPIYPTLTAASVRAIFEHAEVSVVLLGKLDGFAAMEPGIPAGVVRVRMPLAPEGPGLAWDDIVRDTPPLTGRPLPSLDDLATLIYTSGSTGTPKGVMHTYRSLAVAQVFVEVAGYTAADRMVSYLPLAHVAERALVEQTSLYVGFPVFFVESLDTFVRDVQAARPTLFGGVPRIWQKLQGGVLKKMSPRLLDTLLAIPIVRGWIGKKVLTGLGMQDVRLAVSGAAPLSQDVLAWYRRVGLNLRELYGMTENFAGSHFALAEPYPFGTVGAPIPGVTVKLGPDGEVWMKGPGSFTGYYKDPALTAEAIDAEGFLHTGDRGSIDAHGNLRIVGRVKELFKTGKGKYVAPAPIEVQLAAHPDVEYALVTGAGRPQPVALVVVGAEAEGREVLTTKMEAHLAAVNAQLDPHEKLDHLVVVQEAWTVENGLLTPSLKIKRSVIEARYAAHLDRWLTSRAKVVLGGER